MICLILVIGSAILAPAAMVAASVVYRDLVDLVNTGKPREDMISAGDKTRILSVLRQHRDAFPESSKRALLIGLGLSGIIGLLTFTISAVTCFGTFT